MKKFTKQDRSRAGGTLWCWRLVNKDGEEGEKKVIERGSRTWYITRVGDPASCEQHQES